MFLSLTKDVEGKSGFYQIKPDDVLYLSHEDGRVLFHLKNEEYTALGSLKYFYAALNASGYRYEKVDRNTVVNMDNVVLIDQNRGMLYFDEKISPYSKSCTIALTNYRSIVKQIMAINPSLIIN
ncbi:LytTR family transcriptional regulator DNA-binding domain-containing protein [Paenibacillus sp. MAHUQ-46]|uniref:LytTR family transcriptional regulator DNA-binding domain-containing protein n=1 Tax=Paenibacillus roseus TaxID=2798579 RepID=A0A934MLQ5_9BACL|nr:LytTR family DNA-binding domain-containing protein [Paenibacillus roseus]MBJ6362455.1 LytTR family transcriptional regulator DNA-binding domain-containing protein [Paenibacillus roseus]